MNMKRSDFLNVPTEIIKTALGDVELPVLYQDYGYTHFFFWADYKKVEAKLRDTIFKPCRFFNGKAGVMLNFFNYRETAIGPYNEVGLSMLCHPRSMKHPGPFTLQLFRDAKKWTMGGYVIDLPVTTEIANTAGREIWNYPKFVTPITIEKKGKNFTGIVDDPELQKPLFTLEGKIGLLGMGKKFSTASFISHTTFKQPLRTLTEVKARFKINLGFSGSVIVNPESSHIMAKNLRDLGLENKKPFFAMHADEAQMILYGGNAVT